MHKRGQVTVFAILGILIIVILAIIFYLYGSKVKIETQKEAKFDFSTVEPLKILMEDCLNQIGNKALTLIGKQGGEINPGLYQNWNCKIAGECDHVAYLCYTTENSACYNKKPFLKSFVENEIITYVSREINRCINLESIKNQGYNVKSENLKVNTKLNDENVIIDLDYPITISKGEASIKQDKFSKTFNIPLGRLIKVAEDVVNMEINSPQGVALYEAYVLAQDGEVQLARHTYKDSEIYVTNLRNNPYKFYFAIQNYVRLF